MASYGTSSEIDSFDVTASFLDLVGDVQDLVVRNFLSTPIYYLLSISSKYLYNRYRKKFEKESFMRDISRFIGETGRHEILDIFLAGRFLFFPADSARVIKFAIKSDKIDFLLKFKVLENYHAGMVIATHNFTFRANREDFARLLGEYGSDALLDVFTLKFNIDTYCLKKGFIRSGKIDRLKEWAENPAAYGMDFNVERVLGVAATRGRVRLIEYIFSLPMGKKYSDLSDLNNFKVLTAFPTSRKKAAWDLIGLLERRGGRPHLARSDFTSSLIISGTIRELKYVHEKYGSLSADNISQNALQRILQDVLKYFLRPSHPALAEYIFQVRPDIRFDSSTISSIFEFHYFQARRYKELRTHTRALISRQLDAVLKNAD